MRTLKSGTKPKPFPWIGIWSCGNCKGVYELTEDDARLNPRYHDHYDGESIKAMCKVMCPCCHSVQWMHPAERPTRIVGEALTW